MDISWLNVDGLRYNTQNGAPLLTWINLNPSVDK